MQIINFNAGPAELPQSVIENCKKALSNYNNSGVSILEISHRGEAFRSIIDETKTLIKELLSVPDGYEILLLQGSASLQFAMIPFNLLNENENAAYIETGYWSEKAINEAKNFGKVKIAASSVDKNFNYIPQKIDISGDEKYLHYTSNNTVYGTQFHQTIECNIPLICDMSSDLFSRKIDVSKYALIYAATHKNAGTSGLSIVIINPKILGKVNRKIPSILDFKKHIEAQSIYSTPPVFSIYATLETLRWLKNEGGVDEAEKRNKTKAEMLYDEIDSNPFFEGFAEKSSRSLMNITFKMTKQNLEEKFIEYCKKNSVIGIAGHRAVGAFRVSLYNAIPLSAVEKLIELMKLFKNQNK